MDAAELMYAGATQQAEMVAAGEVSSRELVEASLSRIEALDPQLNAFVEVYAKEALAAADNIDRSRATGSAAGRLRGVPIAVKDEHDIAGHPTGWGLAGNKRLATSDGPVPRRLREAGAVIVGKTRLPELAIFTESEHAGVTRKPLEPGPHVRRLVGRQRGSGRGRHGRPRHRQRRGRLCAQVEQARPWAHLRPPTAPRVGTILQ